MARVHYVACSVCQREYYLDQMLYEAVISNPKQKLKCPFCKSVFYLEFHREPPQQNNAG